ncbi:MAG: hypothetical protein K2K06_01090 [Oscillospiraceae bacterium]|nr:hypothetical protein [Oscillospiraceae bacterium]
MNENIVSVHQGIEVMSVEYSQAVQADDLVNNGLKLAQIGIAQMCTGVKMMHDDKLYKQFGFKNFEEYCQSKGFTKQYGNQLVRIAKMLEQENGNSSFHFEKLGVKKLYQLAMLEPEQRDKLAQNVELETASTRDIEKEIKVIKAQHKADIEVIKKQHQEVLDRQKSRYEANIKEQQEILEQAQHTCENYKERMKKAKEKAENLTEHIVNLERQIQELESIPKDVSVAVPVEITEKLQELTSTKEELEQKKASLEAELQETRKREQEAKAEQNVNAETIAKSAKQIEELQAKITELESQSSTSGAEPDAKELFKPYFQSCMQSINLMLDFIVKHKQDSDFGFLVSKAEQTAEAIKNQLQSLKNQSE